MKVNQHGEGSGRQSSRVVLRAIILMAVGLSLLFSGAAQAQISFTNVATGPWSAPFPGGEWADGGAWAAAPTTGSNIYTIVFTNTASDVSTNDLAGNFHLNQLIFAPPAQAVTLTGSKFEFAYATGTNIDGNVGNTNIMNALPQLLQNSTNLMTLNVGIQLDTNMTFAGTGTGGVTIGGSVTGAVQITKNGPYVLTLNNPNSYSGGTVINNGAVAFASGAIPANGTITVSNSSASVWFQDGNIPSQLDKSSVGGLGIGTGSGSTNYDFSTSGLSNMSLVAGQTMTNAYPLTPSTNVYGLGALAGTTFTYTNQLTGAYSLNIGPGGGTVVLTNNSNSFTGGTTIRDGTVLLITADNNLGGGDTNLILSSGGTLEVTNSFILNDRAVTVNASGGGITVDTNSTLTITNAIGGPGVLTKSGAGNLSLKATNTVGGVTINAGRVILSTGIGLSNAVVTINVNDGFTNTSSETTWVIGGLSGSGHLWLTNGANGRIVALTLGNDNNTSGDFSNRLYSLWFKKRGNSTQILSGTNAFAGSVALTNTGGGVLQFNITNAFGGKTFWLDKSTMAAGYPMDQWFLQQVADYSTGVVALASNSVNALDFSSLASAPNACLSLGAVGNVTYSNAITSTSDGVYRLGGGGGTLTLLLVNGLSGAGSSLLVSGNGTPAGTVVLAVDNTFGGPASGVTVTNATLQLASTGCAGSGSITVNGGTINLVTGASNAGVGNGMIILGQSFFNLVGADRAYGGDISASNATLFVNVPGTRTLTFRGSLQNFSGTIDFGNSSGATRFYSSPGGSNATWNLGTNSASLNERDRYTTVYFGAISSSSTNTGLYAPTASDQTGTCTFNVGANNADATFAGLLGNGGPFLASLHFDKVGTGVWTLSGNTMLQTQYDGSAGPFCGGMNISSGAVVLAGPYSGSTNWGNAVPSLNVWTVVPDNGLRFSNTTSAAIGGLAGSGNISLLDVANVANGVTLTINSGPSVNTVYSGNLTGNCSSAIIKRGPGVIALSGTNTYCGGTYIYGGILGFGSDVSFPASGPLTLSTGTCVGLFLTNVGPALLRIDPGTAGGIAVSSNSAGADVNFATGGVGGKGITNAWFVAGQTLTFTGNFTPLTNIVRLGANAGATFFYSNQINNVAGWAPTALYVGDFGGGTVALFPNPAVTAQGVVGGRTNTCGFIVTNNVMVTNMWVTVTNNYSGGTYVWGDTNAWSPLYIADDANLGAPGTTLTLSNADLQVTNRFGPITLGRPIVLQDSSGIGVDPSCTLTLTNAISGQGPLTKYGTGLLVVGSTNNTFSGGWIVNDGVLAFASAAAATNAWGNVWVSTNTACAVAFQFPNIQSGLGVVKNINSSLGGVALYAANANENVNFSAYPGANLYLMSLVAAENLTYGGTYTPWRNDLGGRNRLAAMPGATLTYTNTIKDVDAGATASFLVVGGVGGDFGGTVFLTASNTYSGGGSPTAASVEGFGATAIMAGTLYITNESALGAPGVGGSDPQGVFNGGLMFSNGTLRTTNTITLNNRLVQLVGNATFNVEPGSMLVITNTIQYNGPTNISGVGVQSVSLTKTNSGLLVLSGTNNYPPGATKIDVYINGGIIRAKPGVGINFFPPNSGVESNSIVYLNNGIWDVLSQTIMTNRVTAYQRSGGVSFQGGRCGLSAIDNPLGLWWGTDAVANTNVADASIVSTQHWNYGPGTPFAPSTLVLNEYTANQNLTWYNNINLNSGWNTVTIRTIDVSATNIQVVSTIVGSIMNCTSTNNTPGPYPALNATNGIAGLTKTGIGTLVLAGTNSYNGATTINNGTLALGISATTTYGQAPAPVVSVPGGSVGSITNSMFIVVGNSTNGATFDVSAVAPYVIGANTNQALAGGPGTIVGDVILTNLDTLAPGDTATSSNWLGCPCTLCSTQAVTNAVPYLAPRVGTLTFSNNLKVASTLIFDLGTNSDTVIVASNLTVGGMLYVRDSGGLTNNLYTLFSYGGSLVYNGLSNTMPVGFSGTISNDTADKLILLSVLCTNCAGAPCTTPWASFTASTTNGPPNLQVTFTDTSTGTMDNVTWTFGDGNSTNYSTTTPVPVTYTYTTGGHYSVTQIVDSASCGISTNGQPNLIWVYTPWEIWQNKYFGCIGCSKAAANVDADGDGISNTNEFLAGTDPTNSMSALRITSVVRQAGTNIVVTWTAVGGKSYVVQTNAPPANGSYTNNFADLTAPISVPGNGGDTTAVYTNWAGATNIPSLYYRIRLGP